MESFLEVGIQLYLQIQVLYYLFRNNKSKLSAVNNLDIRHWESNQVREPKCWKTDCQESTNMFPA